MDSLSRAAGFLESTRDLTLDAARDARRTNPTSSLPIDQLKKLLDSRNEREVLEGLRKVITQSKRPSATGQSPLLFSAVVKNIASPSLPVKKLVYLYLIQHAEAEPDTALLAINTIQKTLSANDPHLRALALRVMSSIRVPVISQIVVLGIKRGLGDMSPVVRRAAALAIPKCLSLDPTTSTHLIEYLSTLVGDRQALVAGAAMAAFLQVCPDRIDLIHKHYRSLVRKLVDMDEWGQLATLRLLTSYARQSFPLKTRRVPKGQPKTSTSFYGDEEEPSTQDDASNFEDQQVLDPDLSLLLNAAKPLLYSRTSAVIVAVARLYLYLTPANSAHLASTIGPLVSLLRTPPANQEIALYSIVQVALALPSAFASYLTHFLVRHTDSPVVRTYKSEMLTIMFPHVSTHGQSLILSELGQYAANGEGLEVAEAVRALGRCAQTSPPGSKTSDRCLRLLLDQIASADTDLVAESLTVIRHLIQADPRSHISTVTRLAKSLDVMTSPRARASTIWLIGEFAGLDSSANGNIAADVLRILVKGFADEAVEAKLQIVTLAAKVQAHNLNAKQSQSSDSPERVIENGSQEQTPQTVEDRITKLWLHTLLLSRYDTSYDLRDRARLYRALLSSPTPQLASLLLLAPKPVPTSPSPSESRRGFTLGSASAALGSNVAGRDGLSGYEALPDWVEAGKEPDSSLRDEMEPAGEVGKPLGTITASERLGGDDFDKSSRGLGISTGPKKPEKTLDDWLAESGDDEETDEEEDEEESDEEESSEESSEDESEDESEDDDAAEQQRLVS